MTKKILAAILTMVVLGGVLWAVADPKQQAKGKGPRPTPGKKQQKVSKRRPQRQMLQLMKDANASQMLAVAKIKQLAFKVKNPHHGAELLLNVSKQAKAPAVQRTAIFAASEVLEKAGKYAEAAEILGHVFQVQDRSTPRWGASRSRRRPMQRSGWEERLRGDRRPMRRGGMGMLDRSRLRRMASKPRRRTMQYPGWEERLRGDRRLMRRGGMGILDRSRPRWMASEPRREAMQHPGREKGLRGDRPSMRRSEMGRGLREGRPFMKRPDRPDRPGRPDRPNRPDKKRILPPAEIRKAELNRLGEKLERRQRELHELQKRLKQQAERLERREIELKKRIKQPRKP